MAVSAMSHLMMFSLNESEADESTPSIGKNRGRTKKRDALSESNLPEEVNGTASTSTERTNNERLDGSTELLELLLDNLDHLALVLVGLQTAQSTSSLLCSNSEASGGGTGETGVKTERGDSSSVGVLEKLEVVERSSSLSEPLEDRRPAGLVLVAVGELNVGLGERLLGLFELLETDDGRRQRAVGVPRVGSDELAADAGGGPL